MHKRVVGGDVDVKACHSVRSLNVDTDAELCADGKRTESGGTRGAGVGRYCGHADETCHRVNSRD